MSKCPECQDDFCYAPLIGGGFECVNPLCKFYSPDHWDKMKEEIYEKNRKKKAEEKPQPKQTSFDWDKGRFDDDDGDILYATGYGPFAQKDDDNKIIIAIDPRPISLPSSKDVFKAYPSGPYKKP